MKCFVLPLILSVFLTKSEAKEVQCGLPPFVNNFPSAEKAKIEKIWSDYQKGHGCEEKRVETKKVLQSLSPEVRRRVLFPSAPSFLRTASQEVRAQFEAIWNNHDISRTEKPEKFQELAEKLLNPTQMREFEKYLVGMKKKVADFELKLSKLSPEARAVHEKLNDLRQQRHNIYKEASESIRKELDELYKKDNHPGNRRRRMV